jgi:hypothetical protein
MTSVHENNSDENPGITCFSPAMQLGAPNNDPFAEWGPEADFSKVDSLGSEERVEDKPASTSPTTRKRKRRPSSHEVSFVTVAARKQ